MKKLLFSLLISFSSYAQFTLESMYIEATRSISTNRHWSIPKNEIKRGDLSLFAEISIFKYLRSRSKVESFYTDVQFRYIALDQELYIKPTDQIELFIKHKSEHGLDFEYKNIDKYPNTNSVGIRIYLK